MISAGHEGAESCSHRFLRILEVVASDHRNRKSRLDRFDQACFLAISECEPKQISGSERYPALAELAWLFPLALRCSRPMHNRP
jgi:hypothetical protein